MNQRDNKRKLLKYLAKVGPPSSAPPQELTILRDIRIPTPKIETRLYSDTVKPRLPLSTLKVESLTGN